MNKKKLAISITSLVLAGALSFGGTLAYFTDRATVNNVITMGSVSGSLTETGETKRSDGTTGLDYDDVKPGQVLAKDPKVTLAANSERSYVRIRIGYTGLNASQVSQLEELLELNSGWNKKAADGYFYYNNVLSPGDSTKIFEQVRIPTVWGNDVAGITFQMNVTAELIQADNFSPTRTGSVITGW